MKNSDCSCHINRRTKVVLKNEHTGEVHTLTAGSLLWVPTGSTMSIVQSKGVRVIYVEQAQREAELGTGET